MRYILLMDKSCISWLGKYLMITESWPPQVVQDLLISTAWGQMVRYLQKQLLHKPVRVSKKVQDQIATNIISTSLQPIGRLGVDYCWHWKKTKKLTTWNMFQTDFNWPFHSVHQSPGKRGLWTLAWCQLQRTQRSQKNDAYRPGNIKNRHTMNLLVFFCKWIWKRFIL